MKLTMGERIVLAEANAHPLRHVCKVDLPSNLDAVVDQLEECGLLKGHGFGVWHLTDAGRVEAERKG